MRKLKDGSEAEELEFPVYLQVFTKCPSKWKLIDLETGEEYIGVQNHKYDWKKIKNA